MSSIRRSIRPKSEAFSATHVPLVWKNLDRVDLSVRQSKCDCPAWIESPILLCKKKSWGGALVRVSPGPPVWSTLGPRCNTFKLWFMTLLYDSLTHSIRDESNHLLLWWHLLCFLSYRCYEALVTSRVHLVLSLTLREQDKRGIHGTFSTKFVGTRNCLGHLWSPRMRGKYWFRSPNDERNLSVCCKILKKKVQPFLERLAFFYSFFLFSSLSGR